MDAVSEPETLEDVAAQIGHRVAIGSRADRNTHRSQGSWSVPPNMERASVAREKPTPAPQRTAVTPLPAQKAPPTPRMPAVARMISDYTGLIEALRERVDELGVTREELDHLSGLQPGYSAKLLTRRHIKGFGKVSLGPTLGAIGCKLLLVEDTEATARITTNAYDQDSILNQYGSYGSRYSNTSIFNQYCPYGGAYGQFSPENPYNTQPPTLYIKGEKLGVVTVNEYVADRISYTSFLHTLKNDIAGLLNGQIARNESSARRNLGDTFIEAADGVFLGSLNPNNFDTTSIFNRFGPHGSRFNSLSIFNKFGPYGGKFSALSPFNPKSLNPPRIMSGGKQVAYLTVNTRLTPRVDPSTILDWAKANVRRKIAGS